MLPSLFVIASLALASPSAGPTVDDLIAKNIKARGGLEKIKSVKSIRITGHIIGPQGVEVPMVLEQKRPNKTRVDTTVQGMTVTQAYNGKIGWVLNPFGSKIAEPLSAEELTYAEDQADIDGPLVDWKAKGHKVELVRKEKVEGTDVYKLKVTLKSGFIRYMNLDADTLLEIKDESKRTLRGTEVESETLLGDYKEIRGILYPHAMETAIKGRPQKTKITVDKIELDVSLDDDRFSMPAKKEPPAEKKQ